LWRTHLAFQNGLSLPFGLQCLPLLCSAQVVALLLTFPRQQSPLSPRDQQLAMDEILRYVIDQPAFSRSSAASCEEAASSAAEDGAADTVSRVVTRALGGMAYLGYEQLLRDWALPRLMAAVEGCTDRGAGEYISVNPNPNPKSHELREACPVFS
jgi:hypothetical protein